MTFQDKASKKGSPTKSGRVSSLTSSSIESSVDGCSLADDSTSSRRESSASDVTAAGSGGSGGSGRKSGGFAKPLFPVVTRNMHCTLQY